jgi:hypothetical protein
MGVAALNPSCGIHTIVIQNPSEAHTIVILNPSESSWRCDGHHSAAALADTSFVVQARTDRRGADAIKDDKSKHGDVS